MGKSSRAKRKRAAVRSAKRARTNTWWYGLTALVLIAGIALIVYSRATMPEAVGPFVYDKSKPATDSHNQQFHWHAALGVYDCDHWVGDGGGGEGVWTWPFATDSSGPARAGTNAYAGLHSHADGIIHMEPQTSDEAGRHATVGKYFTFGGWKISATSFDFLNTKRKNGDKCGAKPGKLQWALGKWDQTDKKQKLTAQTGNPGNHKLRNGEIVVIAFLPEGKGVLDIGDPLSVKNLAGALGRDTAPGQHEPVTPTPSSGPTGSSTPGTGSTPAPTAGKTATTSAGATPTSAP
jgi:hypothetical protein